MKVFKLKWRDRAREAILRLNGIWLTRFCGIAGMKSTRGRKAGKVKPARIVYIGGFGNPERRKGLMGLGVGWRPRWKTQTGSRTEMIYVGK